jgi:hypothetical protein
MYRRGAFTYSADKPREPAVPWEALKDAEAREQAAAGGGTRNLDGSDTGAKPQGSRRPPSEAAGIVAPATEGSRAG